MFGWSKNVKLAHFELSTFPYKTDVGCYYALNEIAKMTEQPLVGNITPEKFFDFANQNAKCLASRKNFRTVEDETKFVQSQTNLIGIVGRAGVGKTTLIQSLLLKALGKERLYNSNYIFYINMNVFDSELEINLFQFVGPNLIVFNQNRSFLKLLFSKNVLIFVDSVRSFFSEEDIESNLKINKKIKTTPQKFLINILKGNVLPQAKKIIAFRPENLEKLPEEFRPHSLINILGYNQNSKLIYVRDLYKSYSFPYNFREKLNLILQHHCCTTIGFALLFPYINMINHDNFDKLLKLRSTTDLFTVIIMIAFYNSSYEVKPELKRVSELAWKSFKNNESTINIDEQLQYDGSGKILFQCKLEDRFHPRLSGKIVWHLIIQEYLAAFYLVYYSTATEFQKLFSPDTADKKIQLTSSRFEMVTKFMFGLCSKTTFLNLSGIDSSLVHVFPEKRKQLLQTLVDSDQFCDDCFLKYISWAYEMECNDFTQQLSSYLEDEIYLENKMQIQDFAAIQYFLKVKLK